MKGIIVGIDPGVTAAYAIVDFNGSIIAVDSKKHFSLNSLISAIANKGKVNVVATDVITIPNFVLNVAKKLKATIIKPSYVISTIKKKKLVREFLRKPFKEKIRIKNKHELAALSASIMAYKHFGQLLNKIKGDKKVKNAAKNAKENAKEIALLISLITKKSANIKKALKNYDLKKL